MNSLIFLSIVVVIITEKRSQGEILPSPKEEAIIGGSNARPGMFPWTCALYFNDQFVCTSSLISNMDILTAAHCVFIYGEQQPASKFHAVCNVNRSASSVRIEFDRVNMNPNYDDDLISDDVAVLNAKSQIETSDNVQPISLAASDLNYKKATAMGWGQTSDGSSPEIPEILQYVEQVIVGNIICSLTISGIDNEKICATGLFTGICLGDSGGPLVYFDSNNQPVQIGITSYLNAYVPCGFLAPSVFSRVSQYIDFIIESSVGDVRTVKF